MYYSYKELMSRTKTRYEVAGEYGVNRRTLYRMLKKRKVQLHPGALIPRSLTQVYKALGFPMVIKKAKEVKD